MNIRLVFFHLIILFLSEHLYAQADRVDWDVPRVVTPGKFDKGGMLLPPSDAIILFDGKDFSEFENKNGDPKIRWIIKDGVATIPPKGGDIQTKRKFRDFQLHLEWSVPKNEQKIGEFKGNSGIYLQGKYEIQILNSYENLSNPPCQVASIYKQKPPLVNVMAKPGEWNTYDIVYTAPTFKKDGTFRTYPVVTVFHNGVVVQNNVTILGITAEDYQGYASGSYHDDGPILIQDHQSEVSFRNMWIREL